MFEVLTITKLHSAVLFTHLMLSLYHSDWIFYFFYSVATLAPFLFLNCPLPPTYTHRYSQFFPALGSLHCLFPLPAMIFLQILTWLTPATPSNLCSNLIFSVEHILTLLLKNHFQLCTNPAFILFSLGIIPCQHPKRFILFF